MNPLKAFIADDEPLARDRLRRLLSKVSGVEILGEAGDGVSALEQIASLRPDVVLLDVDMPELNGLGVAAALPSSGPAVVFVTAYDAHALKAFELAAVDYLVKPVSEQRLHQALQRVRERKPTAKSLGALERGQPRTRMALRCGAKYRVFDPSRISAIISKDHYSALQVDGEELLADDGLDALMERLDPELFLRVHRGGIINLHYLKELQHEGDRKYVAVLADAANTRVQISRDRLPMLKEKLGIE